jgi:MinD superfamily P-loop ATPase
VKIAIYSPKGGCGKTPLAISFAIDQEYALATNESFDAFTGFIEDERLLFVAADEEFPDIPREIDVVFDLAGTMSKNDFAAVSAIRQSDVVIVPIWNNRLSVLGGLKAIESVTGFGKKVVVVATKLSAKTKGKGQSWRESADFQCVYEAVESMKSTLGYMPSVLPLKVSEVFETVLGECTSVHKIADKSGLARYTYRELLKQIDDIYVEVKKHG